MARLKDKYVAEVAPALFKKFGYTSTMQVPKIEKVTQLFLRQTSVKSY